MPRRFAFERRKLLVASLAAALPTRSAASQLETLSDWLQAESKSREAGVQALLTRIREEDSSLHAWVQVLPQKPTGNGKLLGIPFGAKDIIETRGMATEYGSPVYRGRIGANDAAIIQDLRSRGAILLGKTHTAAFAMRDPPPTRNPRSPEHTPGGSSSGSAAAVAAGMVPLALGTQTSGSVIRPASYCGVTGFKPSYGLLSLDGVLQYAKSLDTLGFFTHTAQDMLLLWDALGRQTGREEDLAFGVPEPMLEVEAPMKAAFEASLSSFRKAGLTCRPVDIAQLLAKLFDAQRIIATYEGARFHEQRFKEYGDRLGYLAGLVRDGLQIPTSRYEGAKQMVAEGRLVMAKLYHTTPVILVPAATGPAPLGLSYTGDARMNTPWTALGTPTVSIPIPLRDQLPLGLQITAAHGEDARVLRAAVELTRILN